MYTFNEFNDKPAGGRAQFNDEPEGDRVFESTEKHRRLADRR